MINLIIQLKNKVTTTNKKNISLNKIGLTSKIHNFDMKYVHITCLIVCFRSWDRDNSIKTKLTINKNKLKKLKKQI